jgi:hypothetical protein
MLPLNLALREGRPLSVLAVGAHPDGDLSRPSVYVPLSAAAAQRKVELLHKVYPSQRHRDWWDDEEFLGLARLRGMECKAPYAEAFHVTKSVLTFGSEE